MNSTNEIEMFSPVEMLSPFEVIKETDGEGREWWNSRKLARLMGYQKYWNFERLTDKVAAFLRRFRGSNLEMRTKNGTLISLYETSRNPLFMGVSRYFRCVIPLGFKPKTFRTGI